MRRWQREMKLDLHLSWNETPNRSSLSNFSPAGEEQLCRDEQVNIHAGAAGSSEQESEGAAARGERRRSDKG